MRRVALARRCVKFRLNIAAPAGAMVFIRIAKPVSFFSHLVAVSVRLGACLLAVAMLLSFPALRSHSFVIHFRSPEVRRSVAQHNPLSPMHGQAKLQLARSEIEPVLAIRAKAGACSLELVPTYTSIGLIEQKAIAPGDR